MARCWAWTGKQKLWLPDTTARKKPAKLLNSKLHRRLDVGDFYRGYRAYRWFLILQKTERLLQTLSTRQGIGEYEMADRNQGQGVKTLHILL